MSWLLATPSPLRLAAVFALGALLGGQLNRAIYRLAWTPRSIGPWSAPAPGAPPRRWFDRLPIAGWLFLARESPWHGSGYWVRPMLIELGAGCGAAALYWLETAGWLLPAAAGPPERLDVQRLAHLQFAAHVALLSLMTIATFIDLDEQTIPDAVTVPGTLAALALAAWRPETLPPITVAGPGGLGVGHLSLAAPLSSPVWLDGISGPGSWPYWLNDLEGLLLGLACLLGWCYAILPKTWTTRRGWGKALQYLAASMVRYPGWRAVAALAAVGAAAAAGVWMLDDRPWQGLLSSLVGLAFGGALVWIVRVVASSVLGKEAMGFGDVTLMAMIGAFLGWQPALLVFFLAPFGALFISLAQWLATGRKEIAFGPYLCFAATLVLLFWVPLWERWAAPVFGLGWFVPAVLGVCLLLMALLLGLWRLAAATAAWSAARLRATAGRPAPGSDEPCKGKGAEAEERGG